ncbi:MAG: hypothetical protein FIB01_11930 [Gemmatimonadetes bacterium]|nr:hypothetical protein [Gemmatimonadota bacterium]
MSQAVRHLFAAGVAVLAGCAPAARPAPGPAPQGQTPALASQDETPALAREFRGVWVATVDNIDWPSAPGLPTERQQAELLAIMDRAVQLRLNAVIFQVRTQADALYASALEPWSEWLTGTMGQAPSPFYDPLQFAIEAAHERGLELHAWFNPYRAHSPAGRSPISANHISVARPELVRRYGTHLWLDPGEPGVQQHSIDVMLDVLRRYDVDGIHIDDYFYPYREVDSARVEIPFPDDASWQRYLAAGGQLSRSDWRRHNVDQFVARLYAAIKETKPGVKFGVSPIGIWRPGHPAEACCFDAYEQIWADARKWLAEGSLDYFVPQLYRTMADTLMNYGVMLGWWGEQNLRNRHIYVGMIPSSVRSERRPGGWSRDEIIGQIYVARGHPAAQGHVHFSARALMPSPDSLVARLQRRVYRSPALVPVSPWLGTGAPPAAPRIALAPGNPGQVLLRVQPGDNGEVRSWVVRARYGRRWQVDVVPAGRTEIALLGAAPLTEVAVSAVDRYGYESAQIRLPAARPEGGDQPPR